VRLKQAGSGAYYSAFICRNTIIFYEQLARLSTRTID